MTVYVHAKQIHKRKPRVAACRLELAQRPATLRQLLEQLVRDSVSTYNRRIRGKALPRAMDTEALEDMGAVGRIGFGIPFGSREADEQEALETALQGFADGLFRFFVGDREIEDLDGPLALSEGDTITIIRLTMLTGGFFW